MDGSRVLKAGQGAQPWPRRRVSAAEWMAAERAEALLASAEAEAEAVRRAVGQVREAAREEGRAEGWRQAGAEVEARLLALAEAQARWRAGAEEEVVGLAVELARRIVGQELRGDPGAIAAGVRLALRAAGPRRGLRVRLHPEAVAQLGGRLATLADAPAGDAVELVADPALVYGDVVVESDGGQVDGRIGARLEALRAALNREAA